MSDRTPEPVDEPVELSWRRRPGDVTEVAAATRAAAARARAEALLAGPASSATLADPPPDSGVTGHPVANPAPHPPAAPTARPVTDAPSDPVVPPEPEQGAPSAEQQISGTRRMVSAAAVMMAGTIASRILGLARVVLAAYLLGNNSRQAEIWSLATTVPNSLYILMAGGALNTVLVPQIVRAVKNDADGGEAYTNRIMTAFLLLVAMMAVVFVIAAPGIAWVYSDGAWHTPALAPQFSSMVLLTALCMPQVFFYGAFFLFGQVLNAREKFGPMMWAPIANNVVAVIVLGIYASVWGFHSDNSQPFTTTQALLLGLGSVLGIATQTAVLIPYLRMVGFTFRPRFDLRRTGLGHTFHVAKWTLGFVAVNQLALLVVTRLGTSATVGGTGAGMAAYYNANLLWVLPHSLITVSLATAILPSMSRLAAAGQPDGVGRELMRAIRLTTTALVPVALLYLVIGVPIATLAFRGATKGGDLVGWTLTAFALGLIPFTVQYLVLRAFYAFEDTRATFLIQVVIAGLNALLAVLFVQFVNPGPNWVAPALALSYTLAYAAGLAISMRWFRRHVPTFDIGAVMRHTLLVTGASLPAALVAYGVVAAQKQWQTSLPADLVGIVGAGLAAALVYLVMTRVLGVAEVNQVLQLVTRRLGRKGSTMANGSGEPDDASHQGPGTAVVSPSTEQAPPARTSPAPTPAPSAPTMLLPSLPGAPEPAATTGDTGRTLGEDEPGHETAADLVGDKNVPADLDAATRLPDGYILGDRFRLEDELAIRGSTVTWRATDLRLSRSVLVHVLAEGDSETPAVVAAAKQAAQTTDARFLRVLDAVEEPEPVESEDGTAEVPPPYVVCEWADGLNLRHLLAAGPLTALESAWLVHQLADALTGTHAHRMFHQRLNLDTVVVTNTGNVKTVGFLIEAALHEHAQAVAGEPPVRPERQESEDVMGLGRILYATLVSRWPGGARYGLPAAPITAAGAWQTPAQVRAGVSPTLDRIADRILNPEPRSGDPIRTVSRVALELAEVLGTADASHDLERRVRYLMANPAALTHADHDSSAMSGEPGTHVEQLAAASAPLLSPVPPPPEAVPAPAASKGPPWVLALVGLVVLALVVAGVATALSLRDRAGTSGATAAGSAGQSASQTPAGPYAITGAKDFDPEADKGNGTENPDLLKYAYDGKPETAWTTVTYLGNAKMGNLKPGVGIVFDLGKAVSVSAVQLKLVGNGTSVELRVPTQDAATVTTAPMTTAKDWTVVASAADAGTNVQLTASEKVTTRFVLVYVTQLPALGSNRFQAGIAEVTVLP